MDYTVMSALTDAWQYAQARPYESACIGAIVGSSVIAAGTAIGQWVPTWRQQVAEFLRHERQREPRYERLAFLQ